MKELTKDQEKKLYKLMRVLFLTLSILLFVLVENYVVVQVFRRGQVAVQDLPVACEQTTDGKYCVTTQDGFANVYNGTGRTIEDLVVTVRYVTATSPSAVSYQVEAGDFEPYMKDGKFNAYQLSFKVEPKAGAVTDSEVLWMEFDVESYSLAPIFSDYLIIGACAVACVSAYMFWYSKKQYDALNAEETTAVADTEESVAETAEETFVKEETIEANEDEIKEFLDEIEDSDILL